MFRHNALGNYTLQVQLGEKNPPNPIKAHCLFLTMPYNVGVDKCALSKYSQTFITSGGVKVDFGNENVYLLSQLHN